ncbi:MAG: DUF1848 domain-containing protein [Magnetospirillum sp.]|nr:DUF1848 domain-containing protein [Magnetospirillum sp.]
MIVSASYRTDIPAFYGPWFRNRFRAGFAKVVNPYGGPPSVVPLRDGVDGFVFWTRNPSPFLDCLREVRESGIPFVVSATVTGYPRALETSVVEPDRVVACLRAIAGEFGPHAVVWRYDPILLTGVTPAEFHLSRFAELAAALAGVVDECVVSFATLYRKTERNLAAAARTYGFHWSDPPAGDKRHLLAALAEHAGRHGMRLTLCSQEGLIGGAVAGAACIDARRLEEVAAGWGRPRLIAARVKGNRPGCLCHESRDIGAYDSCPHGCVYCYAVGSRTATKRRYGEHDPEGEFLIPP